MFEEKYKKQYDQIHPSQDLIERTKKLALERYDADRDEDELEKEMEEEWTRDTEVSGSGKYRKIVGGLAAAVALVVTSTYLWNSLQPKSEEPNVVASKPEEPETTILVETTEKPKHTKDKKGKETKVEDDKAVVVNASNTGTGRLAKMAKGGVSLDYASSQNVIMHGNFGIIIYSLSQQKIVEHLEADVYEGSESIVVNENGTKILWYLDSSEYAKVYTLGSGKIEKVELLNGQWEEAGFCGVESVAGSEADIYVPESATGEMVSLGQGQYLQLMYQAPKSGIQASLGISVVQIGQGTEKIYSVFGSEGESLVKNEGHQFGEYYNALGKQIFLKETEEEKNDQDPDPVVETEEPVEIEETDTPVETALPEETIVPEETPEVEDFSLEQP